MRANILLAMCLVLPLSTPAFAQSAPVKDPAKVESGAYTVEPTHTKVLFGVSHFGFSTYYGSFTEVSGTLNFDPVAVDKSVLNVTIQTASVSTDNAKLDGELKGADWLDADKFPVITFKSTNVRATGEDSGMVTGDLTLHGVTKPVTLAVNFNGGGMNPIDNKYTVGFEVSGTINRSDFGITKYSGGIGDDVKLIISGAFEKAN